jgi:hypothetical protein
VCSILLIPNVVESVPFSNFLMLASLQILVLYILLFISRVFFLLALQFDPSSWHSLRNILVLKAHDWNYHFLPSLHGLISEIDGLLCHSAPPDNEVWSFGH